MKANTYQNIKSEDGGNAKDIVSIKNQAEQKEEEKKPSTDQAVLVDQ